jgi:hypothetical protein
MSDDDEGLDEVGNGDDAEKICGGEEGDDISNDEKEDDNSDDINSDIVQCDSTTDDLKSNSSKFVEEMMKDSKYVRKSERTNHNSGNTIIIFLFIVTDIISLITSTNFLCIVFISNFI